MYFLCLTARFVINGLFNMDRNTLNVCETYNMASTAKSRGGEPEYYRANCYHYFRIKISALFNVRNSAIRYRED